MSTVLALRQEALRLVNNMPEQYLQALIQCIMYNKWISCVEVTESSNLKTNPFTSEQWQQFLQEGEGLDPIKTAAFNRLESLRESVADYFSPDFDWRQELQEALDEKYGASD